MFLKILILLAFYSSIATSQPKSKIDLIRKDYYSLKELQPRLKKKSSIEFGYSTEGAEIVYFFNDNNEVLIVEAEFLGETGKAGHEYYFKNDSLFFLFVKREFYNAPILTSRMSENELEENGMEKLDFSKSRFSEDRYYFYDGELIRWLDNNRNSVPDTRKEFVKAAKHHLKFSREFLNKYAAEK